jgi:DNA adenine methylase
VKKAPFKSATTSGSHPEHRLIDNGNGRGNGAEPPRPFLKWAGGKSQLLSTFSRYFPKHFNRYFEPFIGGGAVFFHLQPERAVLSDLNHELINCYQVVRNDPETLIELLKKHRNDKHHFEAVRAQDLSRLTDEERAARLIFLNKTCFNGLYRVNSKGQFNVPFGKYKNPKICDAANLKAASRALRHTTLVHGPFEAVLVQAQKGDFVYLDPPYQPVSNTAYFTSYTRQSFSLEDQKRLASTALELSRRGCHVMLFNSDSEDVRALYSQFNIEIVQANRAINCKGDRRGRVRELLILNY